MPGHKPKKRAPKLLVWEKEIKRNLLLKQNFISISLSSAPLFLVNPALAVGASLMTSSTRVLTFPLWLLIHPLFLLLFPFLLFKFCLRFPLQQYNDTYRGLRIKYHNIGTKFCYSRCVETCWGILAIDLGFFYIKLSILILFVH